MGPQQKYTEEEEKYFKCHILIPIQLRWMYVSPLSKGCLLVEPFLADLENL